MCTDDRVIGRHLPAWKSETIEDGVAAPWCKRRGPKEVVQVKYHKRGNNVCFFIDDAATGKALFRVSRKIVGADGHPLTVWVKPCSRPSLGNSEHLKPGDLERLKQCIFKRFHSLAQVLDLRNLAADPFLVYRRIWVSLNEARCMQAVLEVIEESVPVVMNLNLSDNGLHRLDGVRELLSNAPGVKALDLSCNELGTDQELDKLRGLGLLELWLCGNPLCAIFRDHSTYVGAVREKLPQLIRLDGRDLPKLKSVTRMEHLASFPFHSEKVKSLVLHFLHDYYQVYDSENRESLLFAYHEMASFSLGVHFTVLNPSMCALGDHLRDSCKYETPKDSPIQICIQKYTHADIVAFLKQLPNTQHNMANFRVSISTHTSTLLSFTVRGVFKEVDCASEDSIRPFSRVFAAVPAVNGGVRILRDELVVWNPAKTQNSQRDLAHSSGSATTVTLSHAHQVMLANFSLQSGMNLVWSQKCLQDNEWDYSRAAHAFTQLKALGKIPYVAFQK
ncbi:hypothetical protein JZ751_027140 [Albula glossodonta]|uniref:Nuclear RNA export factor 2 n=1 Tax=Albula glossodonta TaxID=121402 RepID=A0A8T2NDM2_9TELE|nr:hypothetical protein JZ751_027140 [Albula glossodonta]